MSDLSNYEINKAVAKKYYGYVSFWQERDAELDRDLDGVHCMTECGGDVPLYEGDEDER